jgi:tRNA pseudouridine38-40 synthase
MSIVCAIAALLDLMFLRGNFRSMSARTLQLVLHYDGARFAGWQRQPDARTVQGVLEDALERLCQAHVSATGSGRTDAGVHARGQAVGIRVPEKWIGSELRRALNAVLPDDVWVASVFEMKPEFHARYSARSRAYGYYIGTDDSANSPFRRSWEWPVRQPIDRSVLNAVAATLVGEHSFRGFAVRGTAPEDDDHRCIVLNAKWRDRADGLVFEIEANRFLHHMVRFLVSTMLDMAIGRRDPGAMVELLGAPDNSRVSAPAPPHALFLERVLYPPELYLASA